MRFIERHQGCPLNVPDDPSTWCMGPRGTYYTVFGTELQFLIGHMLISILVGLVLFVLLYFSNKNKRIELPFYLIILIPLISAILLFFLLAYLFPVIVVY